MTAVYMHKETFELSAGGCGILTVRSANGKEYTYNCADDFIEVDELIAIPVQILNRKGYKTACCCAGHAPNHLFAIAEIENEAIRITDYDAVPVCTDTYITFYEQYDFPTLPHGFFAEGKKICKYYDKTNESDRWKIMLSIMDSAKALYEWATNLPDNTQ